ncbi:hypothetical protein [Chitinophaga defluvii]|uniref:Uncharacterized protein n=1 Tax=Chitinophaga defluvii TaxID=3163343 RepID=A0ABV2TEX0_9BACT
MEGFKLLNSHEESMLIVFEPIGDTFVLPANELLRIIPYDPDSGLGTHWVSIAFKMDGSKPYIVVCAETHKFKAFYNETQVNVM